jgi:hypothetical protein
MEKENRFGLVRNKSNKSRSINILSQTEIFLSPFGKLILRGENLFPDLENFYLK